MSNFSDDTKHQSVKNDFTCFPLVVNVMNQSVDGLNRADGSEFR